MNGKVDTAAVGTELRPHDAAQRIEVALGRRVEVIGDLLLPLEPSASSSAVSRDIARRLEEWHGPRHPDHLRPHGRGGVPGGVGTPGPRQSHETGGRVGCLRRSTGFAGAGRDALGWSRPGTGRCPDPLRGACGRRRRPALRDGVRPADGAGTGGSMRRDANPPIDPTPRDDRPWLSGIERLDDPLEARRFVTSRLLTAPPPVSVGAAALARCHRPSPTDRMGRRWAWPGLPLATPTDRAATRVRTRPGSPVSS